MRVFLSCLLLIVVSSSSPLAQVIPFDSDRWEIAGTTSFQLQYNGRPAIYLKGASAVIKDDALENGVIEFDIAFSAQRGFSGLFWRTDEQGNREEFYFRPHQSGNADANQYNPVLNGVSAWQLYFGPSYSAPIRYEYNEWMHVRVVFYGSLADIYVDSERPVLSVALKNPPSSGRFGIYASNFAPAYYSNFEYRRLDQPVDMGTPVPEPAAPEGSLMQWSISSSFDESLLSDRADVPTSLTDTLSWMGVEAESTGILNLARYAAFGQGRNTVLAKVNLSEPETSLRTVRFGYSDRVAVYLNGELLYRGSNNYQSRDYRYLGTIGHFDELPIRLDAGQNQLVFAVSENFGGWGLSAVLE